MQELHCSFCGRSAGGVPKLITGPRVFICDGCVGACIALLPKGDERGVVADHHPCGAVVPEALAHLGSDHPMERCNFCGKDRREVAALILGYRRTICAECVDLCRNLLEEEPPPSLVVTAGRPTGR